MASPDLTGVNFERDVPHYPFNEMHWEDEVTSDVPEMPQKCSKYYFKASPVAMMNGTSGDTDCARCCKVLVDKRMLLKKFKKYLEPIVGVPMEYFKIFRHYPNQDEEWTR